MLNFLPANRWHRHIMFWVGITIYFLLPQWIYPDYLNTVDRYFFKFDFKASPYFLPILFSYVMGVGVLYAYAFLRWIMPLVLTGGYRLAIVRYLVITAGTCYLFRLLKALHLAIVDPMLRDLPLQFLDSRHFEGFFINQVYIYEYTTIILILAVYKFFENWLRKQQEENRLMQERIRTEIRLLKAQVNPYFMVNSLERLHQLIENKDKKSPTFVLKLAEILSYVLYESTSEKVPLERDLGMIRQYIGLEQERLGSLIDISVNITGQIFGQQIAPLLLLPFLENAFQHGLTSSDQSWIILNVEVTQESLKFSLSNSVELGDEIGFVPGNGIKMIGKRLASLYPSKHALRFNPSEGIFVVILSLDLTPVEGSNEHKTNPLAPANNES